MSEQAAGATRSPRRGMCAAVLALEGIVVALSTPVMVVVSGVSLGTALAVGLGVAAACLVLAGMLRSEAAYVAGWVVQVAAIGIGVVVPMMFLLGTVFALLWGTAFFLGRRIEQDRAAAYAAYEARDSGDPA
ncbi:DUF4233 domain-containing protein [Nocardioides euryhalodurans]|nr:DUF4233 domain-containing protein [Nocardioides euryhalodurans]